MIGLGQIASASVASPPVGLNPFVAISSRMRAIVILYFVFWRLVPTIASLSAQSTVDAGYALLIALTLFVTELMILAPFLLRTFAGTPIGWLHPLILPTVVSVTFGILSAPSSLLAPVAVWFQGTTVPDHQLLQGWPENWILEAQLKLNLMNLLALIFTYAGFSIILGRSRRKTGVLVTVNGKRIALLFALMLFLVLFFLQLQGGLLAHMATLAGGRFRMREQSGHFLVLNAFLPYLVVLWYAFRPGAIRNPAFIVAAITAIALQFVVTGSRSALFAPLAMLLAVYVFHSRRLPILTALLIGSLAVSLLGVLGEIRRSGREGEVDFSALLNFDLSTATQLSREELESRRLDTGLAISALVPRERGYLLGVTYVAVVSFWIPRSIWPEKPRGAGAYASGLLFGGLDSLDGYQGGGYPVSGAPEAYWNLGFPGVILVHLLFGSLLGGVARWVIAEPRNPFAVTLLIMTVFSLETPNSISLTPYLQSVVMLYAVYRIAAKETKVPS